MNLLKTSMVALAITMTGTAAFAQTADEIINKHIEAVGGAKAWDKIKSVKLVGTMSVQGNEIGITQTIVNDKAARTDISFMGQTGYTIITKDKGWSFMPMMGQTAPEEVPAEQLKMQKKQLNYKNGQLVDKSNIKTSTLNGTDTIDSKPCYKVTITNKDGENSVCYFDAKTYYMVRAESKLNIQGEEQEATVSFSDFKKLPEGIVVPMTIESPQGPITFKSIEVNKPVNEKIFTPEAKKG